MLARAELDALHLAKLASREHSHQIQGASNLIRWLGSKLERDGESSPIISDPNYLKTLLAGHPQLANMGVLSPDGEVWVSVQTQLTKRNWKRNPAFIAALKSTQIEIGNYIISPIMDQPTLNYAYAIRNSKGEVWAILFNGLDLKWLSKIVDQADLPRMSSLLITDRSGQILTYSESFHEADKKKLLGLRVPKIREIAASGRGRALKIKGDDLYRYIVALPFEEVSNLYIAISLPYTNILNQTAVAFYKTLGILGALVLFTMIVVFLVAELSILRAIRSLAKAVKSFGEGDFTARAPLSRRNDEISSLSCEFNIMAETLLINYQKEAKVQEQLRALTSKLQTTREEEAVRISRELHDGVGQALTSLKIQMAHLRVYCPKDGNAVGPSAEMNNSIDKMSKQISDMITLVQNISSELRPSVLDKLGLVSAIEWYVSDIEDQCDLAIMIDSESIPMDLDEKISVTLFRIVQEAVTNIIRHAEASTVEINLAVKEEFITLSVQDDGKGIALDSVKPEGSLGIVGMRERVKLIGGKLSIEANREKGTTVRVIIPLIRNGDC